MARSTKFTHYYPQSGFPLKTDHPLSRASQYPPPGDALSISVGLPPGNSHQYPVLWILTSTQFWEFSPVPSSGNSHQHPVLGILTSTQFWEFSPVPSSGNSHQYPVLGILTSTQFKILNQSRYVKVVNYFHISFFKLLAIFKTCSESKTCNTCMFTLITVITSWYCYYHCFNNNKKRRIMIQYLPFRSTWVNPFCWLDAV
jgi:hypothetical protein